MPLEGFQNILSPVDFSEISARGLRFADALGKCSKARLTVLYADPFLPPPYFTESRLDELKQQLKDSIHDAERQLRLFAERTLGAAPSGVRVIEAPPVDGILKAAGEVSADLIVMGTHGRTGFNRLMLGSVTERVLRASKVPVLTVPPGAGSAETLPAVRNIVCPVNDSAIARKSLDYAVRLAQCFHASLTVLHVKERGAENPIHDLCAWVPEPVRSLCTVLEATRDGEAAAEIIAAASDSPSGLLVMGSRHRRFFDSTVIGTTTARVVRHAPCAVLTVMASE